MWKLLVESRRYWNYVLKRFKEQAPFYLLGSSLPTICWTALGKTNICLSISSSIKQSVCTKWFFLLQLLIHILSWSYAFSGWVKMNNDLQVKDFCILFQLQSLHWGPYFHLSVECLPGCLSELYLRWNLLSQRHSKHDHSRYSYSGF